MANFIDTLRAKRDAGEISTATSSVKIAPEGYYTVQLTDAQWGKNRTGDAEQGKLSFKVIAVRNETDPSAVGSVFNEYVSVKNEEVAERKYLQISDWAISAGCKKEKLQDEDDETIDEAMKTLILACQRYAPKKNITCNVFRKQSDKMDSKGRPYYNNYFDDVMAEGNAAIAEEVKATANTKSAADEVFGDEPAEKSPYKDKAPAKQNKHAVEEDDD